MGVLDDLEGFAEEIQDEHIATEITSFPSGAVLLDIRRGDRLFVLAYSPTWAGYGVDEVAGDEGFGAAYRFGFPDFESAKAKLLSMLGRVGGPIDSDTGGRLG